MFLLRRPTSARSSKNPAPEFLQLAEVRVLKGGVEANRGARDVADLPLFCLVGVEVRGR